MHTTLESTRPAAGGVFRRQVLSLMAVVGFVSLLSTGCSGAKPEHDAALRPVTVESSSPVPARDRPGTPPTAEDGEGSVTETPTVGEAELPIYGISGTLTDEPGDVEVVRSLLRSYDDLVTRLAVQPSLSADPAAAVRAAWTLLVPVESALSGGVLETLVDGPLAAGTRLLPGPDGVSFRHHVEHTGRRDDNSIEFSWCGYSPGIRVDTVSGAVLDDKVAHLRGIGRADRSQSDPQRWVLDAFDQLDMVVMPAGSTDPCPGGNKSGSGR